MEIVISIIVQERQQHTLYENTYIRIVRILYPRP